MQTTHEDVSRPVLCTAIERKKLKDMKFSLSSRNAVFFLSVSDTNWHHQEDEVANVITVDDTAKNMSLCAIFGMKSKKASSAAVTVFHNFPSAHFSIISCFFEKASCWGGRGQDVCLVAAGFFAKEVGQ